MAPSRRKAGKDVRKTRDSSPSVRVLSLCKSQSNEKSRRGKEKKALRVLNEENPITTLKEKKKSPSFACKSDGERRHDVELRASPDTQ